MNLLFLLRHHQRTGVGARRWRSSGTPARRWPAAASTTSWPAASPATRWTSTGPCRTSRRCSTTTRCCCGSTPSCGGSPATRWPRRIADETAAFLLRDLGTADGGLASALDADTDGVEGLTYAWTPAQLVEALGEDDGALGGRPASRSPPTGHLRARQRACCGWPGTSTTPTRGGRSAGSDVRARLLRRPRPSARSRPATTRWSPPGTGWRSPRWSSTRPLTGDRGDRRRGPGHRPRCWPTGTSSTAGCAGSPATAGRRAGRGAGGLRRVAEAFCAVHQLTGEGRWLDLAGELLDVALAHFGTGEGGFYDTADDAEQLITRPADPTDNATPSGLSALAAALVAYSALTGETALPGGGRGGAGHGRADRRPARPVHRVRGGGRRGAALRAVRDGDRHRRAGGRPAGAWPPAGTPRPARWWSPARRTSPGCRCWRTGRCWTGASTAYVCRGFVCDRPVRTPEELVAQLHQR